MKALLLALTMDTAEAGEPQGISCATRAEVLEQQRDEVCFTESALHKKIEALFPGQMLTITMPDKDVFGAYEIRLNDGTKISTFLDTETVSDDCSYRKNGKVRYPTLEDLKDETRTSFRPQLEGVNIEDLQRTILSLQDYRDQYSQEPNTLYKKTFERFSTLVSDLIYLIPAGEAKGWGKGNGLIPHRLDFLMNGLTGMPGDGQALSREKVKNDVVNSPDFKNLRPNAQEVFNDYVNGQGPVVNALNKLMPVASQCFGWKTENLIKIYQ